jgi:hypothetical protein
MNGAVLLRSRMVVSMVYERKRKRNKLELSQLKNTDQHAALSECAQAIRTSHLVPRSTGLPLQQWSNIAPGLIRAAS